MDRNFVKNSAPETQTRVETFRSGPFKFQVGVDLTRIQSLMDRVEDAHQRFSTIPALPEVAVQLEKEVIVSSVFGTNTIEGGTLSEQETAEAINLAPEQVKNEHQRRVVNLRHAYDEAESFAQSVLNDPKFNPKGEGVAMPLWEDLIKDLHKRITGGLSHPRNVSGEYRDNQKGQLTKVVDAEHGGVYTPPRCREDIETLMHAFTNWINRKPVKALPPLVRAPLMHYYFERIHPFWDGNGRVGRVLEAIVVKCAGYKYAHFALARFYLEHLDEYFTAFNLARKAEERGDPYPNTVFVELFLNGMLTVLNRLHDRANRIIGFLLFRARLQDLLARKEINVRQFTILSQLLPQGAEHELVAVQAEPWYQSLYKKRTAKTRSRDLKGLEALEFIRVEGRKIVLRVPGLSG